MGIEDNDKTQFTCESCGRLTDTIYMGRIDGICEMCEGKTDQSYNAANQEME